ncbi:hypothetical protein D3C85_1926320 [compost metagenome]
MNVEQLRKQVQSNMPLIREKFLQNWVSGLYRDEGELWEKISYFQLPFKQVTTGQLICE